MQLRNIPGFRNVIKIIVKQFVVKDKIIDLRRNEDTTTPSIIVLNHTNARDVPILLSSLNQDFVLVAGRENLNFAAKLLFSSIGVIYVDRVDKKNNETIEETVSKWIEKGKHVVIFPESTWNVDEILLTYKMKKGAAKFARLNDAPLSPMCLEYYQGNVYITDLSPFKSTSSESDIDDDIFNSDIIRDKISTLKYFMIEAISKNTAVASIITDYNSIYNKYIEHHHQEDDLDTKKIINPNKDSIEIEFRKTVEDNYREFPNLNLEEEGSFALKERPADEPFDCLDDIGECSIDTFVLVKKMTRKTNF